MPVSSDSDSARAVITPDALQLLIEALQRQGCEVIGPRVAEGAIVYEPLEHADDLPVGWIDEQDGGQYRLRKGDHAEAHFDYVVGPHSWKRYLFPSQQTLWRARRHADSFEIESGDAATPRYAFIGVRACELQAMQMQDRVFDNGQFGDPTYLQRRADAFVVAVNCGRAGGTCFCESMGTGPRVASGFDLALSELLEDREHRFVVESGSQRGAAILEQIPQRAADERDLIAVEQRLDEAARHMGRQMVPQVEGLLKRNLEHPRWAEVARRCLSCGNCTMVCPTCFCSNTVDVTDLGGETAQRLRQWDSCFNLEFSYIHGGSIRRETASRYRQWMSHKLAHWHDQFGTSGCTGCGRCITWCPVGIDITEEARAIRDTDGST